MNGDAIKEFLFRHVEKFIFGLLTVLALFLIYQGVKKPDILATHKPDAMEQRAVQVKASIDDDHWAAIAEPRIPTIDVVARTNETRKPVDPNPYRLRHPWEARSIDSSIKRTDPKLPAPIEVQVTGVVATLAYKTTKAGSEYPLKMLEPADEVEVVEKPKPRPPRRGRMNADMMMMGGEAGIDPSMMDPSMVDPSMMSGGGRGSSSPMMSGSPSSSSGSMYPGGMSDTSMMGAGMPGMKPVRTLSPEINHGYKNISGAMTPVAPAIGHFIAGVALMPHKQAFEAYEAAFKQADGYNPLRDQPYYLGLQLQRADVTNKSVDQLTDADWVVRGSSRYYQQLLLNAWAGMASEIVAGKYRDPELTTAIPPVLLENYTYFASHPKIPLGDVPLPGTTMTTEETSEDAPLDPIIPGAGDTDVFRGKGRTTMGSGFPGAMGSGAYGSTSSGMMGGMSGYGASMGVVSAADQPDHKLIRFYDFRDFTGRDPGSPQPGRKYVYRVRIAVEDPNFPADAGSQPRSSSLTSEVFRRVEQLTAKAEAFAKANPTQANRGRVSTMWSDFSEPSPPVSLPGLTDAFAGPVDPGAQKVYTVDSLQVEFQNKPPKGKVVVIQWDPAYGAPLPVFVDVTKGSVVNKTGTVEVPDPLTMEIKKLPDATVNTSNVVLDLTGGKPLQIAVEEEQTEPGVVLMFDPSGGLKVVDEIDTQRGYRIYSYADERGE
jgi:hypothetical protein